jgi:hypothetical protein
MNQENYLIDNSLLKNNKNENIKNKYFIFLVYLVKEESEIKNEQLNNNNEINNLSTSNIISKSSDNCHHVFIDNLNGKHYDFIKTLKLKDNDLFEFFFIYELEKNINTSFRFTVYKFSKTKQVN